MRKSISFDKMAAGLERAIKRFPMAFVCSALGTLLALLFIQYEGDLLEKTLPNLILTLLPAVPLFTAVELLRDERGWKLGKKLLATAGIILFLVFFYFWVAQKLTAEYTLVKDVIRYVLWLPALILMVTFSPFLKKFDAEVNNGFWYYNRKLFFSLLLTIFWAVAIFAGLSIALVSVNLLFDLEINPKRYAEIWTVVVGLFSPVFFLARIPKEPRKPEETYTYPKEIRLFSQYVLVPLVTLYFLILYTYVVKILIVQEWPEGILAYLISGFALVGIITYVFLRPLQEKTAWVKTFSNLFLIALIPQVGMLFWALWMRVSEYAITENRYFVFIFGCWLLAIAFYFLTNKNKDIRIIPISLSLILILSSFGPWSAFAVSQQSQINRLEKLLIKNDILIDGLVRKSSQNISKKDQKEISAIFDYLNKTHGLDGIQPWFEIKFSSLTDLDSNQKLSHYQFPSAIMEQLLGLNFTTDWGYSGSVPVIFITKNNDKATFFNIADYQYLIDPLELDHKPFQLNLDNNNFSFELNPDQINSILISKNNTEIARIELTAFLKNLAKEPKPTSLSQDKMKFEFENEQIELVIYFDHIFAQENNGIYSIQSIDQAKMFFNLKNP